MVLEKIFLIVNFEKYAFILIAIDFKAIFAQSYWPDWKICETFFKAIESVWSLPKTQEGSGKAGGRSKEECSKMLRLLFGESADSNVQGRGCLLKIILELEACYLEDNIENGVIKGVEAACGQLERLLKSLFVLVENCDSQDLISSNKDFLVSSVLYIFGLLCQATEKAHDSQHKKTLVPLSNCVSNITRVLKENMGSQQAPAVMSSSHRGFGSASESKILALAIVDALDLENELENLEEHRSSEQSFVEKLKHKLGQGGSADQIVNRYYARTWKTLNKEINKNLEERAMTQGKAAVEHEKTSQEGREKNKKEIRELMREVCEMEHQRRKEAILGHENYKRVGKSSWKKVWKRLRIYVGQWKHPEFYDQDDVKDNRPQNNDSTSQVQNQSEKVNKISKKTSNTMLNHKISKYEIKSRARPFLKVSLVDPKHAEEVEKNLDKLREGEKNSALQINEEVCVVKSSIEEESKGKHKTIQAESEGSPHIERGSRGPSSLVGRANVTSLWSSLKGGVHNSNSSISFNQIHQGSPGKHDNQILNRTCKFI